MSNEQLEDRLIKLFYGSLKMMAVRGYDITRFRVFYEEIEHMMMQEERGIKIPFSKSISELTNFIQINNLMFYGNDNKTNLIESNAAAENFSYLVTNHRTGYRTLVYFSSIDKKLSSDDFANIIKVMKRVSIRLTGNDNFCAHGSLISGILVLKNKPGSNPSKKTSAIDNLEHILEEIILSHPYDNVIQSQHSIMLEKEQKEFFSDQSLSRNLIPSMNAENDTFLKYINGEPGETIKVYRNEFSGQALDKSIYYRQIK